MAGKNGSNLAIACSNLKPNFILDLKTDLFNPFDVFDFAKHREYDNYMKIVKDDENVSLTGDKGNYFMQEKFQITFLAKYTDDADCAEFL